MADQPVTVAEELVTALIVHLLSTGQLTDEDVLKMTSGLSEDAQHLANCLIIEALPPIVPEQPRPKLKVVE